MAEQERLSNVPSPLVAAMGWLLPGGGYLLIGEKSRALVSGTAIVLLYLLGLFIAGVRVVEVPGYDSQSGAQLRMLEGRRVSTADRDYPIAGWSLTSGGFLSEIANKPWFVGQVLAGPICLASAAGSVNLAQQSPEFRRPHSHLETVGTLYTAIAGMLNLMVMIDAAYRAGQPPPQRQEAE